MDESTVTTRITPGAARDQLMDDLKSVLGDVEELLRATKDAAGEKVGAARARAEATLNRTRAKIGDLDEAASAQAKQTIRSADDFVRDHPWQAVGIAAAAGLVVGLLITRR